MEKSLYYFVSDVHLGLNVDDPEERERRFCRFLSELPPETKELYLLGDIFDFWVEYRYVVPAGFVRTLGKLAELSDRGVRLYLFKGNHDCWTFGYLEKELGATLLEQPFYTEIAGKRFCLGHGDGVGKTDLKFGMLRKLFYSSTAIRMLKAIHPRWTFALGLGWSKRNRLKHDQVEFDLKDTGIYEYFSENRERADFFIFGHYHSHEILELDQSRLYVLGDWIKSCGAACFDGEKLTML